MYKDLEPLLTSIAQADDAPEDFTIEKSEIEASLPLKERLILWLDSIDR
ncbi:MAG: hypothetical protein JEY91_18795 [Spirochaetaceae bacterium]|nr:hypothetical protein [Spirochaetaceae bacterium]